MAGEGVGPGNARRVGLGRRRWGRSAADESLRRTAGTVRSVIIFSQVGRGSVKRKQPGTFSPTLTRNLNVIPP